MNTHGTYITEKMLNCMQYVENQSQDSNLMHLGILILSKQLVEFELLGTWSGISEQNAHH